MAAEETPPTDEDPEPIDSPEVVEAPDGIEASKAVEAPEAVADEPEAVEVALPEVARDRRCHAAA